ncbi:competence type IV pilus minor pilin ComGD [Sporosarcina sp. FSL K6-3508]|uniref:competence type IV pilus minor pilin ComGD n=1 Tax=Sporosarcina TaxID=1569 RepID=UPI00315AF6F0
MQGEQGFTFLELLLVLSIIVILTAVILPFSEKRLLQVTEEDALKSFMVAVHETQLYAITHQEATRVEFRDEGNGYRAYRSDRTILLEGKFPEGMMKIPNDGLRDLSFSPSGNMYPTGKIKIRTKKSGQKTISFQFERGRMMISG